MQSLDILHLIPNLNTGGGEKFLIDLCNEQSKEHNVYLYTLNQVEKQSHLINNLKKEVHLCSLNKGKGFDLLLSWKIYKLIKKINPDIVNTHLKSFHYSILAILFTQSNFFHTIQNIACEEEPRLIFRKIRIPFFKSGQSIPISVSNQVYESCKHEYPMKYNHVIPNAIQQLTPTQKLRKVRKEVAGLKQNKKTTVFINVGRIARQKNQVMLTEVFKKLEEDGENVLLLILGRIETGSEYIYERILKLKSNNTYLLGNKSNVADYLSCSDAFCMSSEFEGLPLSLLEAMSLKVVPICTPVGGIPEVIKDNQNGLLAKDLSFNSFYKTVKSFIAFTSQEKEKLAEQSYTTFLQNYSINAISEKYIDLYSKYLR